MRQNPHNILTLRVPDAMASEVRRLAEINAERQAVIWRRLIRLGLLAERRNAEHDGDTPGRAAHHALISRFAVELGPLSAYVI